jgi:hypothetical protein
VRGHVLCPELLPGQVNRQTHQRMQLSCSVAGAVFECGLSDQRTRWAKRVILDSRRLCRKCHERLRDAMPGKGEKSSPLASPIHSVRRPVGSCGLCPRLCQTATGHRNCRQSVQKGGNNNLVAKRLAAHFRIKAYCHGGWQRSR